MDVLKKKGDASSCPGIALLRGDTLLTGLRHYTSDTWKDVSVWTLPGGRCDDGETLEEALRREVREETGITEMRITAFIGELPGSKEGDVVYLFSGTTDQEPRLAEPEKFSEWRWEKIADMPQNFINPQAWKMIADAQRV